MQVYLFSHRSRWINEYEWNLSWSCFNAEHNYGRGSLFGGNRYEKEPNFRLSSCQAQKRCSMFARWFLKNVHGCGLDSLCLSLSSEKRLFELLTETTNVPSVRSKFLFYLCEYHHPHRTFWCSPCVDVTAGNGFPKTVTMKSDMAMEIMNASILGAWT